MYREHAPGERLAAHVECFWTRRAQAAEACAAPTAPHRVLPDGCIDLIFAFHAGAAGSLADAYAVGTMTRAVVVAADGRVAMLGVRFRPGGATALLGGAASPLTDLRASLRDAAPGLPTELEAGLDEAGAAGRVRALAGALERLLPRAAPVDPLVGAAASLMTRAEGRVRVEHVGARLGVTRQHLARAFARHVGVPPKTFARVARVQALVRRAAREAAPDWSRLAMHHGYADQAHLCGEFRELVGLTPTEWAAAR